MLQTVSQKVAANALPISTLTGRLVRKGGAEVAFGNDVAEIGDELFRKGLVQPKILAKPVPR